MTALSFYQRELLIVWVAIALAACSTGPQVTRTHRVSESADVPYQNILVIYLSSSFDSRRYLETEVVNSLSKHDTQAVASTSMMDSRTPVTRETFVAMVDEIDADAVLVTQLVSLASKATVRPMSPESTYTFRPTYYYNVWSVELDEYVEPEAMEYEHSLVLATQFFSVHNEEIVWAIESNSNIQQNFDKIMDYSVYVDEATSIVASMAQDKLIAR